MSEAGEGTIRIECPVAGHEGEAALFKRAGWRFKHLRMWEEAGTARLTVEVVGERLAGWDLREDGQAIPFRPGPSLLDELPPAVATWLIGTAFTAAYRQAGRADFLTS